MKKVNIISVSAAVGTMVGGVALASPPNVSNVTLTQPQNMRVAKVEYTVDEPCITTFKFKTNGVEVSRSEMVHIVRGDINRYVAAGPHEFTWDALQDIPERMLFNLSVEVTAWATNHTPLFCAVNLEGGPSRVFWYNSEAELPHPVNTSYWKNDWLLMRKIPVSPSEGVWLGGRADDSTWKQNNEQPLRLVHITKPFYVGVFEVTQKQYNWVTGTWPDYYTNALFRAERPLGRVTWESIRGNGASGQAYDWPTAGHAVLTNSFMGLMRSRTGGMIEFDLPTEAQWEYACRAGTTGTIANGIHLVPPVLNITDPNTDVNANLLMRYQRNGGMVDNGAGGFARAPFDCTDEFATARVGSYPPNAWGLYDMQGNVSEWCLDWQSALAETNASTTDPTMEGNDPVGPTTGLENRRMVRGGSITSAAHYCRPAARRTYYTQSTLGSNGEIGFRVVAPAEVMAAPAP